MNDTHVVQIAELPWSIMPTSTLILFGCLILVIAIYFIRFFTVSNVLS